MKVRAETEAESGPGELAPAIERFLVGNTLFTLLHEFGHVIVRDFDVPLLGLEENAADTIAAVSLARLDRRNPDRGFAEALVSALLAQALIWKTGLEEENLQEMLWAQHQLSAQRYARLVCLLYGSDPERYSGLIERSGMSDIRADYCAEEWLAAERGVLWVVDNFGRTADDSDFSSKIGVKYGRTADPSEATIVALLQSRQLVERLAESIEARFVFTESLEVQVKGCGSAGAFWDYEYRELVLCFELLRAFVDLAGKPDVQALLEELAATNE